MDVEAGLAFACELEERDSSSRPSSAALRVSRLLQSNDISLDELKESTGGSRAEWSASHERSFEPAGGHSGSSAEANLLQGSASASRLNDSAASSALVATRPDEERECDRLHIHMHSHLRSPVEHSQAHAACGEATLQLRKAMAEQQFFDETRPRSQQSSAGRGMTKAGPTFHMHFHVHKHIHKAFVLSADGTGLKELKRQEGQDTPSSRGSLAGLEGKSASSPSIGLPNVVTTPPSSESKRSKPKPPKLQDVSHLPSIRPASETSSPVQAGSSTRVRTSPLVRFVPPPGEPESSSPLRSKLSWQSNDNPGGPQPLTRAVTVGPGTGLFDDTRLAAMDDLREMAVRAGHPAALANTQPTRLQSEKSSPLMGSQKSMKRRMMGGALTPAKAILRSPGNVMFGSKSMPATEFQLARTKSDNQETASDVAVEVQPPPPTDAAAVQPAMLPRLSSGAPLGTASDQPKSIMRQGSKQPRQGSKQPRQGSKMVEIEKEPRRTSSSQEHRRASREAMEAADVPTDGWMYVMGSQPSSSEGSARSNEDDEQKQAREQRSESRRAAREVYEKVVKAMKLDDVHRLRYHRSTLANRLQVGAKTQGFAPHELSWITKAFERYSTRATEISDDVLHQVCKHLGYLKAKEDVCKQLAESVSPFSSLTLEEFKAFMLKYAEWELKEHKKDFASVDTDKDGRVSVEELRTYVRQQGYTPFENLITELLQLVEATEEGGLDMEGFTYVKSIVLLTKGFTSDEVSELRLVFEHYAVTKESDQGEGEDKQRVLEIASLGHALLHIFGPQSDDLARRVAKTLGVPLDRQHQEEAQAYGEAPVGLDFVEFLLWGRQVRETELKEYQQQFELFDDDGSGRIDRDELTRMLFALGYTPLRKVVDELMEESDPNGDGIDFEEFVILMAFFRQKECFSNDDVAKLQASFDMFRGSSGSLTSYDLLCLMRHMGYIIEVHEAKRYMREVDYDGSNRMEFRGFLRLMVLQREADIVFIRDVFTDVCEWDVNTEQECFPATQVPWALSKLKYTPVEEMLAKVDAEYGPLPEFLSFEELLEVVDVCQKARQAKNRQNANLSAEEISRFHQFFAYYDSDDNNVIERGELGALLHDLGVPMATAEDQKAMLQMLEDSRQSAISTGIPANRCGKPGSPTLTFAVLIHLVRILRNKEEKKEVQIDFDIADETNFTAKEVSEFYTIFRHSATLEKGTGAFSGFPKAKHVTFEALRRLFPVLGVPMTPQLRAQLDRQIKSMGVKHGSLDFREFVLIMRWFLEETEGLSMERRMNFERQRQTLADNFANIQVMVNEVNP
mmetsp:Transcript_58873/g.140442  ORF Transcript_58873/g.140442 Transcript_58873/m.140442 type:complete len:1303 (-) Transcript_58873:313-4221(-)